MTAGELRDMYLEGDSGLIEEMILDKLRDLPDNTEVVLCHIPINAE